MDEAHNVKLIPMLPEILSQTLGNTDGAETNATFLVCQDLKRASSVAKQTSMFLEDLLNFPFSK